MRAELIANVSQTVATSFVSAFVDHRSTVDVLWLSALNEDRCQQQCGNGVLDPGEACDDGNQNNTDGCLDATSLGGTCQLASCGDGFVYAGVEGCDDGNGNNADDCPEGGSGSGTLG